MLTAPDSILGELYTRFIPESINLNSMSSPAVIRILSEADVDAYWSLRLESLEKHPESFGATFASESQRPRADVAKQLAPTDDSFILGAFAPHLIGVVGLRRRSGEKLSHKGVIWGMYVSDEARGRSIGRALVQTLIDKAISLSTYEQLLLTVVTSNTTARQLYLSMGFKTYGTETRALKLNNAYLDEDLMELTL